VIEKKNRCATGFSTFLARHGKKYRLGGRDPSPLFFVSVAAKGLSDSVSLLFATLVGSSISVADKGLTVRFSG
jgi:hypothetical protein